MNQPAVFISCVSPEFRQTRSRVAAILTRLGYTPVIQEIFGTEPGDLRQVLRDKIDACEGLIQIVGQGYGAEPPTVDAEYGEVSYTQFEFLYARSQKKKTWLLFACEACARDTPLERLDLPSDPAPPDPAEYQAERRALQLAYCDERKKDGHLYHTAASDTDLDLKVERLRDELAELRGAFRLWQNKVLHAFAVGFVLLALIGGSVWWFGFMQHHEIQQISADARHITREKIRAQLLESVERTRQAAPAEPEKAEDLEERERLRQGAEKAYDGSIARGDELAASFAEIESTDRIVASWMDTPKVGHPIKIGAMDFEEQGILGEIVSQYLERKHLSADRIFDQLQSTLENGTESRLLIAILIIWEHHIT
jgi:hypothetical protein